MQKKFLFSYLFIIFVLLGFLSLSRLSVDKTKSQLVALLAPYWEKMISIKSTHTDTPYDSENGLKLTPEEHIHKLEIENKLLSNELSYAAQLIEEKGTLNHLISNSNLNPSTITSENQAYTQRLLKSINHKIQILPARVIFRSIGNWNSSFWINVGEDNNGISNKKIVAKNSPVLYRNAVIGLIDYVGKHQSRVRLITDVNLNPSVRVARGGEQEAVLSDQIDSLIQALKMKKFLSLSEDQRKLLLDSLISVQAKLILTKKTWYLAKGELQGAFKKSARFQSQLLKGSGFNFDFDDELGEARDLRSGKPINNKGSSIPIVKLNDLLITTGYDGIFPPNLPVARVSKIELLKEGDYYYQIEAEPAAGNLGAVNTVFIIPPINQGEPYDK